MYGGQEGGLPLDAKSPKLSGNKSLPIKRFYFSLFRFYFISAFFSCEDSLTVRLSFFAQELRCLRSLTPVHQKQWLTSKFSPTRKSCGQDTRGGPALTMHYRNSVQRPRGNCCVKFSAKAPNPTGLPSHRTAGSVVTTVTHWPPTRKSFGQEGAPPSLTMHYKNSVQRPHENCW